MKAFAKRREADNMRAAFIAANIISVWMPKGKSVTPGQLLGIKPKFLSQAEIAETRAHLKKVFYLN